MRIFFLIIIFNIAGILYQSNVHAKSSEDLNFNHRYLSNYFSALLSYDNRKNDEALKFFNSSKSLLNKHNEFLREYLFSLVENGEVAKYLESLNIPYTGSDQLSSATCMDKNKTKTIIFENNFLTPEWVMKNKDSDDIIDIDLTFPLIVKPNDQGSTIGLSIVKNKKELKKAFELAGKYTSSILLESFINGREITVPVVANKAYSIVEIIPSHDLYDYECKYTKGMSEYI